MKVLKSSGKSLLSVGVKSCSGHFQRGDVVSCTDENGNAIARGLVNYNADETGRLAGQPTDRIVEILGYDGDHELIHRDNLVLL